MKNLVFILMFSLFGFSAYANDGNQVNNEIQFLIQSVEQSQCIFHRNGSSHSAQEAADHLRLKLRRGNKYADTAEHFIDRLASKSSWTGKSYHLECESGQRVEVGSWMNEKLAAYRSQTLLK